MHRGARLPRKIFPNMRLFPLLRTFRHHKYYLGDRLFLCDSQKKQDLFHNSTFTPFWKTLPSSNTKGAKKFAKRVKGKTQFYAALQYNLDSTMIAVEQYRRWRTSLSWSMYNYRVRHWN